MFGDLDINEMLDQGAKMVEDASNSPHLKRLADAQAKILKTFFELPENEAGTTETLKLTPDEQAKTLKSVPTGTLFFFAVRSAKA